MNIIYNEIIGIYGLFHCFAYLLYCNVKINHLTIYNDKSIIAHVENGNEIKLLIEIIQQIAVHTQKITVHDKYLLYKNYDDIINKK